VDNPRRRRVRLPRRSPTCPYEGDNMSVLFLIGLAVTAWAYYNLREKLMSFQAEVTQEIMTVINHIAKVEFETRGLIEKIAALEEIIGQEPELISPELAAAIVALKAQVQVVDDLVPDPVVDPVFDDTEPTPVDPAPVEEPPVV